MMVQKILIFKSYDWLFVNHSEISDGSGRGRGLRVPELGVGDPDVAARDEHRLLHHQPRHRAGAENSQVRRLSAEAKIKHLFFARYHLILLPLLPIIILLIQNYSTYNSNAQVIQDLSDVSEQVRNSLDFAELTKKLQQERVSVALKFFIKDRESNIFY